MKRIRLGLVSGVLLSLFAAGPALAQANNQYLGQIIMVGFTFCPQNWADANGQIMSISSNTALYSLFGTTYGGNGTTTFGLPDLRGRVPMHVGQGPNLPANVQGEVLGAPTTTLTVAQMPSHNHSLNASAAAPTTNDPSGNLLATYGAGQHIYVPGAAGKVMSPAAIGFTGGGQPFDQYQPSLVLRYCVALTGIFPPRP